MEKKTKKKNKLKLSIEYIAGLFDGEGFITINKNKGNFVPTVGIKMNGFHLLKELNNQFNGYFNTRSKYINRPLTEWTLRGAYRVANFLNIVEPHLIIKKEQAQLCLELCKTYSIRKSNNHWVKKIKVDKNVIDARKKFINKIKNAKLNVI